MCGAGCGGFAPRLIRPEQCKRSVRGKGANTRYVCDILPDSEPAHSLLVVEVRTPSGHSSSYPPHKHDTDDLPHQSFLEETYYHQVNPPQGFVFQRVYTDDRSIDQAMAVENSDLVVVPKGYHRSACRMATSLITSMSWPAPSAPGISITTRSTVGCWTFKRFWTENNNNEVAATFALNRMVAPDLPLADFIQLAKALQCDAIEIRNDLKTAKSNTACPPPACVSCARRRASRCCRSTRCTL